MDELLKHLQNQWVELVKDMDGNMVPRYTFNMVVQEQQNLDDWLRRVERLLVIEIGAGSRIPTVRRLGESLPGQMIRINPTEPELGRNKGVSIASGGLEALRRIEAALNELAAEPGAAETCR